MELSRLQPYRPLGKRMWQKGYSVPAPSEIQLHWFPRQSHTRPSHWALWSCTLFLGQTSWKTRRQQCYLLQQDSLLPLIPKDALSLSPSGRWQSTGTQPWKCTEVLGSSLQTEKEGIRVQEEWNSEFQGSPGWASVTENEVKQLLQRWPLEHLWNVRDVRGPSPVPQPASLPRNPPLDAWAVRAASHAPNLSSSFPSIYMYPPTQPVLSISVVLFNISSDRWICISRCRYVNAFPFLIRFNDGALEKKVLLQPRSNSN